MKYYCSKNNFDNLKEGLNYNPNYFNLTEFKNLQFILYSSQVCVISLDPKDIGPIEENDIIYDFIIRSKKIYIIEIKDIWHTEMENRIKDSVYYMNSLLPMLPILPPDIDDQDKPKRVKIIPMKDNYI